MAKKITLLVVTKNSEAQLEKSLDSVKDLADEIVVVNAGSTDKTTGIAKEISAKIFINKDENWGKLRSYGISKTSGDWILMLDPDEIVSQELKNEIKEVAKKKKSSFDGYLIPYQNHFLGRPLRYGGENYKILRLIKRNKAKIKPSLIHEKFDQTGLRVGILKGKIYHYSYRSIFQVICKFTDYARRTALMRIRSGEKLSLKKLLFYGPHLFWARFVSDKGYKDGLFRIPLDLAFAYMESMSYWLIFFVKNKQIIR